jgi:hypothetical protein
MYGAFHAIPPSGLQQGLRLTPSSCSSSFIVPFFPSRVTATCSSSLSWLGAGPGLVDENELIGIDKGLRRAPDPTPHRDVRTVLLGGAERFFKLQAKTGDRRPHRPVAQPNPVLGQ